MAETTRLPIPTTIWRAAAGAVAVVLLAFMASLAFGTPAYADDATKSYTRGTLAEQASTVDISSGWWAVDAEGNKIDSSYVAEYNYGSAITPIVAITNGSTTVARNATTTDGYPCLLLYYYNNRYSGTANVEVHGYNSAGYSGSFTVYFTISTLSSLSSGYWWAQDSSGRRISSDYALTETGKGLSPVSSITNGTQTLTSQYFDVKYFSNVNPGRASFAVVGKRHRGYKDTFMGAFTINAAPKPAVTPKPAVKPKPKPRVNYKAAFLSGKLTPPKTKTYKGKKIKPNVKLVVNGTKLKKGKHYRLKYRHNKAVGKATITIIGKGVYKGAKRTCTFKIIPRKTAVTKLQALRTGKQVTLKWKKGMRGCKGYQICYSKSASMKGAKTKTVKSRGKTKCTLRKLASGTRYYVKIRTYCVKKGAKYYSKWSKAKVVSTPRVGSASGYASNAVTGRTIAKAKVVVCTKGGKRVCSVKSSRAGRYRIKSLATGTYRLKISKKGYRTCTMTIVVRAGKVTYCENAFLVKKFSGYGYASGTISSATTGYGISGAKLLFKSGWNNTRGRTLRSCTTGWGGWYSIRLKAGYYTVVMKRSGYVQTSMNIYVGRGSSSNQNGVINPRGNKSTKYRAVLTWGANPRDLDSHLVSTGSKGSYHVLYSSKTGYLNGRSSAMLDVDDISSYGPETTTFAKKKGQTYTYYVYLYNGSGSLKTSRAKVKLYHGNTLVKTYSVPARGSGRYWNVFSIRKGKVSDRQTITSYPTGVDSTYASQGTGPSNPS